MTSDAALAAAIQEVAALVDRAESVLFITGAGVSADSGLPTYRGVGGLYNDESRDPEEGLPIEVLLSGPFFRRQPATTWKYIRQIEEACRGARPNPAHQIMAAFEGRVDRLWVMTQNVDGLHTAAGSQNVIELHGNIHRLRCTVCSYRAEVEDYAALPPLPRCPRCQSVLRPDVVLFEEMLPPAAVAAMQRERARGFDLVFTVGTSSPFPYVTDPVLQVRRRGGASIEINPGRTRMSELVTHKLSVGAADAMTRLAAALKL